MVYLIPSILHEEGISAIPQSVTEAIGNCQVFFVENERTTRRFFKMLNKEMVIDDYEWHVIHKAEPELQSVFVQKLKEGKNIGIVSEAGCPGIADPGQILVGIAHEQKAEVKPLVGPSSVLLALMASGLNGQSFRFNGYLPIDSQKRVTALKQLEAELSADGTTQIFIETPYRNDAMLDAILKTCRANTRLCIASELTGSSEKVKTLTIGDWKRDRPSLHKKLVIFLLGQ